MRIVNEREEEVQIELLGKLANASAEVDARE